MLEWAKTWLYGLYNNEFFGIGLFIVITILAFSFLVILFFGKKDEKLRNAQEVGSLENNNNEIDVAKEEILQQDVILEVPAPEDEAFILNVPEPEINLVANDSVENIEINNTESNIEIEDSFTDDVFKLKEVPEEIEEPEFVYPSEETVEEKVFEPISEPIFEEEKEEVNIFSNEEEEPIKKFNPSPIFSSVYLNDDSSKDDTEEEINIHPTPRKPEFVLPKKIELPKLNNEPTNSNIIKDTTLNKDEDLSDIFGNIEEESYTIK